MKSETVTLSDCMSQRPLQLISKMKLLKNHENLDSLLEVLGRFSEEQNAC